AYIRRWVPELAKAAPDLIHRLDRVEGRPPGGYPSPIVDHAAESLRAQAMYRLAKSLSRSLPRKPPRARRG
ncbi:MAG: FAD-binding domain-containing protein, partial [Candidatus Aminicenantales bacterium]